MNKLGNNRVNYGKVDTHVLMERALYNRIVALAHKERRSVVAQIVYLLEKALEQIAE